MNRFVIDGSRSCTVAVLFLFVDGSIYSVFLLSVSSVYLCDLSVIVHSLKMKKKKKTFLFPFFFLSRSILFRFGFQRLCVIRLVFLLLQQES